jgi:pectin methylesterase-like acyl-CoA thioesterase
LGQGFIAKDMGFRNTAGAIKQQAVALMSNSDKSIFYRCQIDAFQDTLYVHANRQFYRECNIYGTVDFIFGDAVVVLQNCNIFAKVPMPGQQNTITAQGKSDPRQITGISIHDCTISPSGDLTSVQTYLGRPWKDFSTTVILYSNLGSLINPAGWLPWVGTSAPSTIFYSEYRNYGPGSSTKNRVKWKGVKTMNANLASSFSVGSFINGNEWIPAIVPFKSGI